VSSYCYNKEKAVTTYRTARILYHIYIEKITYPSHITLCITAASILIITMVESKGKKALDILLSIAECGCGTNYNIDTSSSTASDLYDDVLFHHSVMPKEVSLLDEQDELKCESFSTALSNEQIGCPTSDIQSMRQDNLVLSQKESFVTARNDDALSYTSSNLLSVDLSEDDDLSYITNTVLYEGKVVPIKVSTPNEEMVVLNIESVRSSHSLINNLSDLDATILTISTTAPTLEHTEGRSVGSCSNTSF